MGDATLRARVRELFHVDPESGQLVRKISRGPQSAGSAAGSLGGTGYLQVDVDGRKYLVHRLIWLHVHGSLPQRLDHADGDRTNNRIANLRPCSQSQNSANRKRPRRAGRGRFKGVSWHKKSQQWRAYIVIDGKQRHLGFFSRERDAARAYSRAAKEAFGSFARSSV